MSETGSGESEAGADRANGEDVGAASFPASDPPQAWTWEPARAQERTGGQGAPVAPPPDEATPGAGTAS